MENTIYQIYDKIFKKILTLSPTAVVNLINGLFDSVYTVTGARTAEERTQPGKFGIIEKDNTR